MLLWERKTRRLLTVSAYEDLGGPGGSGLAVALAVRADATLASLSPAQRAIARRIFVRLVQLGEGRQDTRRPQAVRALRAPGDDPALFDATLRHLTNRRLLTTSADSEEPTVELGHEAMITHWPTLADWIDESRASELTRRRIERDSDDWRRNGRDSGDLYRRRKLADALELAGRQRARAEPERDEVPDGRPTSAAARPARSRGGGGRGAGRRRLARQDPVRDAWLRHETVAASPQVRLPGGAAIVGNGGRVMFPTLLADKHEVTNQQYRYCVQAQQCARPPPPATRTSPKATAPFPSCSSRRTTRCGSAPGSAGACPPNLSGSGSPGARTAPSTPGETPRPNRARSTPSWTTGPAPWSGRLGCIPQRRQREGVEQLIGNVREWTATRAYSNAGGRTVLQGNWNGHDRVPTAPTVAVVGDGYQDAALSVPSSPTPANLTAWITKPASAVSRQHDEETT